MTRVRGRRPSRVRPRESAEGVPRAGPAWPAACGAHTLLEDTEAEKAQGLWAQGPPQWRWRGQVSTADGRRHAARGDL